MKEIIKKIYLANDGTEFNDERECIEYEASQPIEKLKDILADNGYYTINGCTPVDLYNDLKNFFLYQTRERDDFDMTEDIKMDWLKSHYGQ